MKRILIVLTIVGVSVLALFLYIDSRRYIAVKVMKVKHRDFNVTVSSTQTGTIKTDRTYRVVSEGTGRVLEVLFQEGMPVRADTLLVKVDSEELTIKTRMLLRQIKAKEQEISSMKLRLEMLKETIHAEIDRSEAALAEARKRWNSYRELFKKGYISEMAMKEAERIYRSSLATNKQALARTSEIEIMKKEIQAQENLLASLKRQLQLTRLQYKKTLLKAPVDGIVIKRFVHPGDLLRPGTPVAEIIKPEDLYVEARIDEADIAMVKVGQKAEIRMDAYPEQTFTGKVVFISPVVLGKRLEAKTFTVKVIFDEPPLTLKPGMSADIEIITATLPETIVIPTQAILEDGLKRYVYTVKNKRARLTEVTAGLYTWTHTQILKGLNEGDLIIINPDVSGLYNGAKVEIVYESR